MTKSSRGLFVMVVAILVLVPSGTFAQSAPGASPLDNLQRCVATSNSLSVVILMDESGSLKKTDPEGRRVPAARAFLRSLAVVAEESAQGEGTAVSVDVLVAGFGSEFTDYSDGFVVLADGGEVVLDDVLKGFIDRDTDLDTDYVRGLREATVALAPREGCKLLAWFTDGIYDIESTVERPDYEARIQGDQKPSASERPQVYEQIGREWLCDDADAIADTVRAADIHLVTLALALRPLDERLFTQRLTEGTDPTGGTCGALLDEASQLGLFLDIASAEDLFFRFASFFVNVPPQVNVGNGPHSFVLPFGTTVARVVASAGTSDYRVTLESPESGPRELVIGEGPFSLGSVDIEPSWLSASTFILEMRPDQSDQGWVGEWILTFESAPEARSEAALIGFLEILPDPPGVSVPVGTAAEVSFIVRNRVGTPPTTESGYNLTASVTVRVADGTTIRTTDAAWVDPGRFAMTIDTTGLSAGEELTVHPTVTVDVNGVLLAHDGAPARVSVAPLPPTTTIPPPPTAPASSTTEVVLPPFETPGESEVGSIEVVGGSVDGCAEVVESADLTGPGFEDSVGVVLIAPEGAPTVSTPTCAGYLVPAEGEIVFGIRAVAATVGEGDVEGFVEVSTETIDGRDKNSSRVIVQSSLLKPRSVPILLSMFALLVLLGIGGPLLMVILPSRRRAVFEPSSNDLKVAAFEVNVEIEPGRGTVATADDRLVLPPSPSSFTIVGSGSTSGKTIAIDPAEIGSLVLPDVVTLRVVNGLIGGDRGTVACRGHQIVTKLGSSNISLDLHGCWFLVLTEEPSASDEQSGECVGSLVLLEDATQLDQPVWTDIESGVTDACRPIVRARHLAILDQAKENDRKPDKDDWLFDDGPPGLGESTPDEHATENTYDTEDMYDDDPPPV